MNAVDFCNWLSGYLDREFGLQRLRPAEVGVVMRKLETALERPKPTGSGVGAYYFCIFLRAAMKDEVQPETRTVQLMLAECYAESARKEETVYRDGPRPSGGYQGMTFEERMATGLFKGDEDTTTREPYCPTVPERIATDIFGPNCGFSAGSPAQPAGDTTTREPYCPTLKEIAEYGRFDRGAALSAGSPAQPAGETTTCEPYRHKTADNLKNGGY